MKIALGQMDIVWENKEENLEKLIRWLVECREGGTDLLLLPELSLTGFSMNTKKIAEKEDEGFSTKQRIASLARMYAVGIGIGYAVEDEGGRVFNGYGLFDKEGTLRAEYKKIHPFSYGRESEYYIAGEQIVSAELEGVRITPFICYDLRFPEIFRLAAQHTELILVPASWPESRDEHWRCLLQARAVENQCYVAGINRTGTGDGLMYGGHSMVIAPDGEILLEMNGEETLGTVRVEPDQVYDWRKQFPALRDRKDLLYRKLAKDPGNRELK